MIGIFLNLQGQKTTAFYPAPPDTGILGTVIAAFKQGGGLVIADANQSIPNSGWAGSPCSGPQSCAAIGYGNPLQLPFSASYLVPENPDEFRVISQGPFAVGQRVSFDVIAAEYGASATNVQAI